jgi:hypothetical protein
MKKVFSIAFILLSILTACNKDWEFPDYKFSSVYFPYQSPIRTLVLGEDVFDNTLDNQRKVMIMATLGGVYENKKDVTIDVAVDNSLAQNAKFQLSESGAIVGDVIPMPSNYYSFSKGSQIKIPAGELMGGLEVQLTDAFFADPRSATYGFVIPLKINSVTNADSVLVGKAALGVTNPNPRKAGDWTFVPKNYVLYAVKYINPYHGIYLRRGKDVAKGNGGNTTLDTTIVYRKDFVEKDMLSTLYTKSLTQDTVSLTTRNRGNTSDVPFRLLLDFNANGDVTVATPASANGYTVSGNGKFVKKGDMWGSEKRDVIHLNYQVNFGTTTHSFTDTLVLRDRGVKFETFNIVLN